MAKYFRVARRYRGGSFFWVDTSPASVILNSEFFEGPVSGNLYEESILLECLSNVVSNREVIASGIISLQNQSQVSNISILSANGLVNIGSIGSQASTINMGQNTSINIASNSQILSTRTLEIRQSILVSSNSNLLDSESRQYEKQMGFLTENNTEFELSSFVNLVSSLNSLQNLSFEEQMDLALELEQSIESEAIFNSFLEAFFEIGINVSTGVEFDIVSIISNSFLLSSDMKIDFSGGLENESVFEISSLSRIFFEGELVSSESSVEIALVIYSKITTTIELESSIIQELVIYSKITTTIELESSIIQELVIYSKITEALILNSIIDGKYI